MSYQPAPDRRVMEILGRKQVMWPAMKIDIRTATEEDLGFLLDARRQTLRTYVIETWGYWDETRQRTRETRAAQERCCADNDRWLIVQSSNVKAALAD